VSYVFRRGLDALCFRWELRVRGGLGCSICGFCIGGLVVSQVVFACFGSVHR